MRIENWSGHDIRFVEHNGEWWAVLKDICDALGLRTAAVAQRLEPDMLERVLIEGERNRPEKYKKENYDHPSKGVVKYKKENHEVISNDVVKSKKTTNTFYMLIVNEYGIYEALFASKRLEARKFRRWTADIMQKLRRSVGLEGYQIMRMTDPEIQADINHILDTLYYDEEKKCVMRSVTVLGGDVEQVPFE